jgi:uncharacterized protein YggE
MAFFATLNSSFLSLTASGETAAIPDEIVASLTAQSSSVDASAAQANVNTAMKQALALSKTLPNVVAVTMDYSVSENTPGDPKQSPTYQASQTLQLTMPASGGTPSKSFTALVGQLQQHGLLLNDLDGDLSARGQDAAQEVAIVDAIHQLQAQASVVSKTLNDSVRAIKDLTVNFNAPTPWPGPRPMVMMAAVDAAPPQAAPAAVVVQASVSATIALISPH